MGDKNSRAIRWLRCGASRVNCIARRCPRGSGAGQLEASKPGGRRKKKKKKFIERSEAEGEIRRRRRRRQKEEEVEGNCEHSQAGSLEGLRALNFGVSK